MSSADESSSDGSSVGTSSRARDDNEERWPFDVELERLPTWAYASSAAVLVVGVLVIVGVAHMLVLLPFLIASSIGRRFASSAVTAEVLTEGLRLGDREIELTRVVDIWADLDENEPRVIVAFDGGALASSPGRGARDVDEGTTEKAPPSSRRRKEAPTEAATTSSTEDDLTPAAKQRRDDLELAILHFQNREQARRFADELTARSDLTDDVRVVGYRPRWVDVLTGLRFFVVATAFFATGSTYGLVTLLFFGLDAWTFMRATQLIAKSDRFVVHTAFGSKEIPYDAVANVDVDLGVIRLERGAEILVSRSMLRDAALASAAWLERGRTRVLRRARTQRSV